MAVTKQKAVTYTVMKGNKTLAGEHQLSVHMS